MQDGSDGNRGGQAPGPFERRDLVALWDRPPEFLPLRPPAGSHHWRYADVRHDLARVASTLDKASSERRVALLADPGLSGAAATDGLHAGIQLLLRGEAAAAHRHSPSALRIGLEGSVVTTVDDDELALDPLDVVLNPSGTWHGHHEPDRDDAVWLDVVDLPLVAAVGGVFFEPSRAHQTGALLDPPSTPTTVRFPWSVTAVELAASPATSGVRTVRLGEGSVMPTMAVTAYAVEAGATLYLPARTGGAVVLVASGSFEADRGPLDERDVIALRSWTPFAMTAAAGSPADGSVALVVDTSPVLHALGLYREEPAR